MNAVDLSLDYAYREHKKAYDELMEAIDEYYEISDEYEGELTRLHRKYKKTKKKYHKCKNKIVTAISYIESSSTIPTIDKNNLIDILSK